MLWAIAGILLVLWLVAGLISPLGGAFIHALFVLAGVVLVYNLITFRRLGH